MKTARLKNSISWCPIFLAFIFTFCKNDHQIKFTVAPELWDETLGNHRAVIEVKDTAQAVYMDLIWRRHDRHPEKRRFIIIHQDTKDTIQNIHRILVNRERCILTLGPVKNPGNYFFYYLPYKPDPQYGFYRFGYSVQEDPPNDDWIKKIDFNDSLTLANLPVAPCHEIQSRTSFDSFYPMEIIPIASEKEAFLSEHTNEYLLFTETRDYPIRMKDEMPVKWLQDGVASSFKANVFRNEYFTFQVGIYANTIDLDQVEVAFSDLIRGNDKIRSSELTCFNTEGIDPYGNSFEKVVSVKKGTVQPMWIGVDIAEEIEPGNYKGKIEFKSKNSASQVLSLELSVKNEILADRGDSDPRRHSRLRWLNSTRGIDDQPVKAYQAIRSMGDMTYEVAGKILHIASNGFPASIVRDEIQILNKPISFLVETEDRIVTFSAPEDVVLLKDKPGIMMATWKSRSGSVELSGKGSIESDGYLNYKIRLKAKQKVRLKDVRLEIPVEKNLAQYMMGMGLPGTETPNKHLARWNGPHDSFWIGNTFGGLWCELRGSKYHGPLLNLYRPPYPESWHNGGKGGFAIGQEGGATTAIVYSGSRELEEGDVIDFEFSLLITPVKKINHKSQFVDRYFHNGLHPRPTDEDLTSGVKIINLHHANEYNPNINYPFVAVDEMKGFVDDMHQKGQKVKIYYTVRELTNYTTELWALRSLGFEILGNGRGGGYPWLQEHLVDGYRPQWYQPLSGKSADASIVNAPGASRWYNYYIEGLAWLVRNVDIDGLYLDDVTYDRRILKRMRKVLDQEKPGCIMDLHSNTGFSKGPAMQYAEFFPYINKIWFGESFQYNEMPPANWLVEVSGIPFGHMGDMLHAGGNPWRGMVYGMTVRYPWFTEGVSCDPRTIWKIWDDFGIEESKMVGYWADAPVVSTSHPEVKATAYLKSGAMLVSVASWAEKPVNVVIDIDWEAVDLDYAAITMRAPGIENFQPERVFGYKEKIPIEPTKGWLILIEPKD